jgi:hypothetical protein
MNIAGETSERAKEKTEAVPEVANGPFKALIAAWTFVAVAISVAGFSQRWAYFYNFGLQDLALAAPLSSLPVFAVQALRDSQNLGTCLLMILEFLLPLQIAEIGIQALRVWRERSRAAKMVFSGVAALGLTNPLVLDSIRAALVVYIAFVVGGIAGYRDYLFNVSEVTSRLPHVTLVGRQGENGLPWECGSSNGKSGAGKFFIGSPLTVRRMEMSATCSPDWSTWRLLYRDDHFIYVFNTVQDLRSRPDTLVVPTESRAVIILE